MTTTNPSTVLPITAKELLAKFLNNQVHTIIGGSGCADSFLVRFDESREPHRSISFDEYTETHRLFEEELEKRMIAVPTAEIMKAARQLAASDRGRKIMRAMLRMIEDQGGMSLDTNNQHAVLKLLRAVFHGEGLDTCEIMRESLESVHGYKKL